ncbi:MAG: hypothetical protein WDO74_31730 [Pseudomonadota bacterium]
MTEADQCSFGFAGGEASAQVLTTTAGTQQAFAASINNIKYDQSCIVTEKYPLSRKVYFNTLVGFETVSGQELALAKCFAGGATGFASLLAAKNLIPLAHGPGVPGLRERRLLGQQHGQRRLRGTTLSASRKTTDRR